MNRFLTVFSNAATSLTNFLVTFAIIAVGGATQLGSFTLLISPALVAVTIARAFTIQLWVSDGRPVRHALGVLGGLAAGSTCVSALVMVILRPQPVFWAIVLATPFVLAQDAGRFRCFAVGRPGVALISDLAWLGVTCAGVGWAWTHGHELAPILVTWASGALLGLAFLLAWGVFRSETSEMPPARYQRKTLVLESIVVLAFAQLMVYGMALISSKAQLGEFRFIQTLSAPVWLIASAVLAHELQRARLSGAQPRVTGRLLLPPLLGGLVATPLALFALSLMRTEVMTWSSQNLIALVVVQVAASLTAVSGYELARARRQVETARWLRVRFAAAAVEPAVGLPISFYNGPLGGALGSLLSQLALIQLLARLRSEPDDKRYVESRSPQE